MKRHGKAAAFVFIAFVLAMRPLPAAAGRVVVYDAATGTGHPVTLELRTRGKVFSAGGKLAEVRVDGQSAGTVLTGADGFGYLKFTPPLPGLMPITARSGNESGRGMLLSAAPDQPVLVVEIDGPVRRLPNLTATVENAGQSLRSLSEKFRIVYIAGIAGPAIDRAWLESVDMPSSVVLSWNGGGVVKQLHARGLLLYAAVGGQRLLDAADGIVPRRFGFESGNASLRVKSWKEVAERLFDATP